MIKGIAPIVGVTLKAYPDYDRLRVLITHDDIVLTNLDFLIEHVGTNNIE